MKPIISCKIKVFSNQTKLKNKLQGNYRKTNTNECVTCLTYETMTDMLFYYIDDLP